VNLQHQCAKAGCTDSGTEVIREERQDTDATRPLLQHVDHTALVVNTLSLHSPQIIQRLVHDCFGSNSLHPFQSPTDYDRICKEATATLKKQPTVSGDGHTGEHLFKLLTSDLIKFCLAVEEPTPQNRKGKGAAQKKPIRPQPTDSVPGKLSPNIYFLRMKNSLLPLMHTGPSNPKKRRHNSTVVDQCQRPCEAPISCAPASVQLDAQASEFSRSSLGFKSKLTFVCLRRD
jgi:hypothetical protein